MARSDPLNRTRYWEDPQFEGLSCLHADFTAHDYAPHAHDGFVIAVTEAGGAEFTSRGAVGEASPSALLVFNPNEPHSGRMGRSRRWRYRSLYFDAGATRALESQLGLTTTPHFAANRFTDADLIRGFLDVHQALDAGPDPLRAQELLIASFGALVRRHGTRRADLLAVRQERARLGRVLELMHDQPAATLRLETLAGAAGLTPFQLIALFKRATGLTPHAYLVQLRLKAAKDALKSGMPIAEAATVAGFYDQSALTRHLKNCYGVTPLQFARAAREQAGRNFHQ